MYHILFKWLINCTRYRSTINQLHKQINEKVQNKKFNIETTQEKLEKGSLAGIILS